MKIKSKIRLMYDSKLQSNDTSLKIRRKMYNLTQSRDQIEPIDC